MVIDRQAVREFLDRDLDNFLWMKGLRRETILKELKQLRVPPVFKTDPWLHQLVCIWIGICNPRFLFLLDMGLGKSKILADLITQTQREKNLEGALITVPRLINVESWVDDLAKHSDLEPWRIDAPDIEEKRERLLYPKGDVTIIDYQGLTLAMCDKVKGKKGKGELIRNDKRMKHLMRQYNWLGLDEIHKLGNWNSLWHNLLDHMTKRAEFVYGATGTLFGKDVQSLHSPFYLVDRGETFGENLGLFRAAFFTTKMNPWKGVQYVYDQRQDARLHEMLQHRSIRYTEDEVPELDLPKRVMREHKLEMAPEQREHYMRALEGLINAGGQLGALDAAWLRMRQIVSGYLVWKDEHGEHVLPFKENPKLDDLEATIDSSGDTKFVVSYEYTETGKLIVERIKAMGLGYEWLYGGTKNPAASRRRFLDDPKCRVFVMNSEAGGTGNDGLQNVARYLYFFETPSSPTARQQVLKRVHRPGQTKRTFIYDAVMKRSVDRGILDGIAEGVDIYRRVVNGGARYKNLFLG
jgi:hypothetical protein